MEQAQPDPRAAERATSYWFNGITSLLWLGLAATLVAAVYALLRAGASLWPDTTPFAQIIDRDPLIHVSVPLDAAVSETAVPDGFRPAADTESAAVPVVPVAGDTGVAVLQLTATLPWALLLIAVFAMLIRLLRPGLAEDGVLFGTPTVRRLRRIGWFAIIGTLAVTLIQNLGPTLLAPGLLPDGVFLDVESGNVVRPGWSLLFMGIAILAVAEILRRGAAMRGDLSGTV